MTFISESPNVKCSFYNSELNLKFLPAEQNEMVLLSQSMRNLHLLWPAEIRAILPLLKCDDSKSTRKSTAQKYIEMNMFTFLEWLQPVLHNLCTAKSSVTS